MKNLTRYSDKIKVLAVCNDNDMIDEIEQIFQNQNFRYSLNFSKSLSNLDENVYDLAIFDTKSVSDLALLIVALEKGIATVLLTTEIMSPNFDNALNKIGILGSLPKEELHHLDHFLHGRLRVSRPRRRTWRLIMEWLHEWLVNVIWAWVGQNQPGMLRTCRHMSGYTDEQFLPNIVENYSSDVQLYRKLRIRTKDLLPI